MEGTKGNFATPDNNPGSGEVHVAVLWTRTALTHISSITSILEFLTLVSPDHPLLISHWHWRLLTKPSPDSLDPMQTDPQPYLVPRISSPTASACNCRLPAKLQITGCVASPSVSGAAAGRPAEADHMTTLRLTTEYDHHCVAVLMITDMSMLSILLSRQSPWNELRRCGSPSVVSTPT